MVSAVDFEKYAKVEDKYANAYVVPAANEGMPGSGDGRHYIHSAAYTDYAKGPIEGIDDPTLSQVDRANQVGVISYSLIVSEEIYKSFLAAGGNDGEINDFVIEFAKKYEFNGMQMKMAFQKPFVDVKRTLRNEFYEGVTDVITKRLPNETKVLQKVMFYRNVQLRSKLTAEQLASVIK